MLVVGDKKDEATYNILKVCYQKLTLYATNMIKQRLLLVPNMSVTGATVMHNGNPRYRFTPALCSDGSWKCTSQSKMCWQNMLYGLPCVHILTIWGRMIKNRHVKFDFDGVWRSTHKMYRRATYAALGEDMSSVAMPTKALKDVLKCQNAPLDDRLKTKLRLTVASLNQLARSEPDGRKLDWIRHLILKWCSPMGHQPPEPKGFKKFLKMHNVQHPKVGDSGDDSHDSEQSEDEDREQPLLVSPPVVNRSTRMQKRKRSKGEGPRQRLTKRLRPKTNQTSQVSVTTPCGRAFNLDSLRAIGEIPEHFQVVHFDGSQVPEASKWLREKMANVKGYVGFSLHFVPEFFSSLSKLRSTRKCQIYGVDVISVASSAGIFSLHVSQMQSEDKMAVPGPFKPRIGHYDDNKWFLLPTLEAFLLRKDVFLAGFNISSQVTRMRRTFYTEAHQQIFNPVTMPNLPVVVKNHSVYGTKLGMQRPKRLQDLVRAVFGMDMVTPSESFGWRTHETLSKHMIEYCHLHSLACYLLSKKLDGSATKKAVPEPSKKAVPEPLKKEVPEPSKKAVTEPSKKEVPDPSKQEVPSNQEVPDPSDQDVPEPSNEEVPESAAIVEGARQSKNAPPTAAIVKGGGGVRIPGERQSNNARPTTRSRTNSSRRVSYSRAFPHKHFATAGKVFFCPCCHYKLSPLPLQRADTTKAVEATFKCPSCYQQLRCMTSNENDTIDLVSSDEESNEEGVTTVRKKRPEVLHRVPDVMNLRKGSAVNFRMYLSKKKKSYNKKFRAGWLAADPLVKDDKPTLKVTDLLSGDSRKYFLLPLEHDGVPVVTFRLGFDLDEARRAVRPKRWKFRLNSRDKERVDEATNLHEGGDNEILSSLFNTQFTRHDFRSLAPGRHCNDEVLVAFMLLCIKRHRNKPIVHVFNSFFFKKLTSSWDGDRCTSSKKPKFDYESVKRWTKYVDISKKKYVFVPIHLAAERHWVLAVINFFDQHMFLYDSLNGSHEVIFDVLKEYVLLELVRKKVFEKPPSNYWKSWVFEAYASEPQENGYDCGVFVCMNTWCLMYNAPTNVSAVQKNMNLFRKYMTLCLLNETMVGAV